MGDDVEIKQHPQTCPCSICLNHSQNNIVFTQPVLPSPVLPHELIEKILSGVPVRSLVQFKCVCKSWKALISNPVFTKSHLISSTPYPQLFSNIITDGGIKIISYPLEPLLKNQSTPVKPVITIMRNQYRILGSYNGLLCLYDINQCNVILWNPSIKFKSQISPTIDSFDGNNSLEYYGFGYDQVNDKYKLLVVMQNRAKVGETVTEMYTFGENSLKTIHNFPCIPIWRLGKCVSGTLNWVVTKNPVNLERSILSFDFENENYRQVLLPQCDGDEYIISSHVLDVLRNCLCVCFESRDQSVVWLMKEYGVAESWTKLMIIPHPMWNWNLTNVNPSIVDPMFISENGKVMVKTMCCKIVLHNVSKCGPQPFYLWIPSNYEPEIHIYHESLVSLRW